MQLVTYNNYSSNWILYDTFLFFNNKKFEFKPNIIILEMNNCLIKKFTNNQLYNNYNDFSFKSYEEEFVSKLIKESKNNSLIVISNCINNNKLNLDIIKQQFNFILENISDNILGIFALTPNKFSKPHTGSWKFIKAFYLKHERKIQDAILISDMGGIIIENKNTEIVKNADVDRAFAWNINIPYYTIKEYLKGDEKMQKYIWNKSIIPPEIREKYIEYLDKAETINIFKELDSFGNRACYVIMVIGPPRCGKSTLVKSFVNKWRNSPFGDHNAIEIINGSDRLGILKSDIKKYTKYINNRISVIIDGGCHTNKSRNIFEQILQNKNIPILYVIINIGTEMAKLFNHVLVEQSKDENTILIPEKNYYIYNSCFEEPKINNNSKLIVYYPKIIVNNVIKEFRF